MTYNFTGTTTTGNPDLVSATIPAFSGDANATFDSSWTGVTSVAITGPGDVLFLWAIYYTQL
jgi:hypothetical protein